MNNAELRDNLINTRIWIGKDNKKLSELLQKRLFKIGFKWNGRSDKVKKINSITSFTLHPNNRITWDNIDTYEEFLNNLDSFKEVKVTGAKY